MTHDAEQALDARYHRHFGRVAGYLPEDRASVDEWQKKLKHELGQARLEGQAKPRTRSVAALARLLELNGIVRMYVEQMIEQQPRDHRTISDTATLLEALNHIVTTAPLWNADSSKRNTFPVSALFAYMMMTPAGEAIFRNTDFNAAVAGVLREWCAFLDSPQSLSVINEGAEGWLSPSACQVNELEEFVIPDRDALHWGWKSFNDYFHRQIKSDRRPIASPRDRKVIVSANDGTVYNIASDVKATDRFWLKGQPYSLTDMLDHAYVERFVGGDVFQTFLSGADYHRWRSPIDGVVRRARVVDGLMFSDAESAGADTTAGTYSQGYETAVNTRGLVFIESEDPVLGMVCVMPIGITEISSVTIEVAEGARVKKGDELGYFSYGGSSMCLVFQPGAIDHFTVENRKPGSNPDEGPSVQVNAQIAVAK